VRLWTAVLACGTLLFVANGSARTREVLCDGVAATIVGTEGSDKIEGTPGPDVIAGLGGEDTISGGDGDDRICGGDGRDVIGGGAGHDVLDTGAGSTDAAYGELGDDRLTGNGLSVIAYASASGPVHVDLAHGTSSGADGNDTFAGFTYVIGSEHDDELSGDDRLNIFVGIGGDDIFRGGGGFDLVLFTDGQVDASLVTGRSVGGVEEGNDTLVGIGGLAAQAGGDTLVGDSRDNFLVGNGGNDTLRGAGGADTLIGGEGDDALLGDAGSDFLNGGSGTNRLDGGAGADDLVTYAGLRPFGSGMSVNLAAHTAKGPGIDDAIRNVETIVGRDLADVLVGDAAGNQLSGGGGNDALRGRAGNDFLDGGTGVDRADGGPGKKDYCLNTDRSTRCEFVRRTRDVPPGARAVLGALADLPIETMVESQSEPSCRAFRKGGGEISIAPPKRIKAPGANDTARWRAELYRQGSSRPLATTPLAEGVLSAPGLERGVPAVWTNPRTHQTVGRIVKRVREPGVYYWKAEVELVRLGPVGSGTLHAYHSPPGSASALPTCDLRGGRA
jgi:Ca2+-binding RTX toxin-like protein